MKLRLCDWALVFATAAILASSIQLEATGSSRISWVWIHIVIGSLFFANIIWHLYLHFNWKAWGQRFRKLKSPLTRWLAILAALTLASAFAALFHWIGHAHSPVGAIHGKIGFLFLALAIWHTVRRGKFLM